MANNLYNPNLDLADSSSESDESFHDLNADVAMEDANSLKNNMTSDGDTASIGSVDKEDDVETDVNIEEEDFKIEWTDTLSVPPGYLLQGRAPRRTQFLGQPHRWRNIDWTTLLLFDGTQIGAYFGVQDSHQIPLGATMHVRYQYLLLDEHNNIVMEGQSNVATFTRCGPGERVDNGFSSTFSQMEFLKHLRKQCVGMQSPGSMAPLVRIKVMVEEEFRPTLVPVGHNSKRDTGMVGLENLGATCYLNALLQMLYHINGFRRAVYKLPHEDEAIDSSTTLALQNVFRNLQTSDREVTTKELTVAFGWTSAEAFLQQDVQEMMRVLVDKLEEKMTGTVVDGYIKALMAGKVRSFICCVNVQYESKREEDYYDIQLDVKGCKDIYESFHKYTSIEMLDGENQYEAGEHGKQDAKKGVIFESFPPVLTIHLKRFDFDLQTMNFTKIHDYFEFPLRLELDQFLAADCPEESRRQPNVYLLHSVLVHQGDVGGGHYYAYIRPTTKAYDYSGAAFIGKPGEPVKMAGKDQQWFKFNDETVLQVPQREAVDYCYGRRIREHEFLRSMSSAYMLVYIREGDAPGIMREVTAEDIPTELGERLDEEQAIKKAKHMRAQRSRWFSPISYATEKELADFRDYSRFQDFINEKALISLDCMRDTNKLGALLMIADHLRRSPADLRLWEIEKRDNSPTLGVSDEIGVDELAYRIKETRFYVEFVEYRGTAEERIEYEQAYLLLRQAETKLVEELRGVLVQFEELHYAPSEDPVQGCGIGCGNLPLLDLKYFNAELYDLYSNAFAELQSQMMDLLKRNYSDFTRDQVLTFIKIYDPYNYLPIGVADSTDESLQSASSEESDSADTDTGEPDMEASSEYVPSVPGPPPSASKQRSLVSKPKAPEYIPVKYLGSHVVEVDDPIASLADVIDQLVRRANPNVPEGWQADCVRFRYYLSEGPTHCKIILPKLVDNGTFRTANIEMNSVLIYVDILPEQPPQVQVPYGFTDAPAWLNYRAYKKPMQIRPFGQREVRIMMRRQRERLERLERQRTATMEVDGYAVDSQATSVLSTGSVHSTPTQSMRRPVQLRDRTNSVGSQQRDRSASVSSLRDRANSIGSELGMSPSRLVQTLNPKALSGKPFTLDVPLQFPTKVLIRRVAQELGVESAHLVLFIVNFGQAGWASDKFDVKPVSLASSDLAALKVMDTLKKLELNIKASARYCIFYHLVPYPLVDNFGNDQRSQYKFTDFLIVDDRIRYWRTLFLEHLRSTARSSGSSGASAVAAAGDIVSAADESTPKRSRTHSEGNGASSESAVQKPREAAIVWPDAPKMSEYEFLEVGKVTTAIPATYTMREISKYLRSVLGIPKNYRELEALKYADGGGNSAQQAEIVQLLRSPSTRTLLMEGSRATSTDELTVTPEGRISPAFPLLTTVIRYDVINEILSGFKKMFVESRSEATVPVNHLFSVGLQHATAEDIVFMRNKHPHIRSMVLSVFSFTLTGQMAVPIPCREYTQGGGPFVSYVREDDDYQSLVRRLAAITGDSKEEWWKMRLAITIAQTHRGRIAHFLPQPSSRGTTPAPSGDNEVSGIKMDTMDTSTATAPEAEIEEGPRTPQKDDSSEFIGPAPGPTLPSERAPGAPGSERLWDIFCRHFHSCETAWRSELSEGGLPPFPQLGIQRSVMDVPSKNRSKRAGGGSIKIV